jgi:alkylation response protein AidB-like acyl-CoA dehydrogenase
MPIINLSEEQKMVRNTSREFTENEIKPVAAINDREHKFPKEIIEPLKKYARAALLPEL